MKGSSNFEGAEIERLQILKYAVMLALSAIEEQRLAYKDQPPPAELLAREKLCWRVWFEVKEAIIKVHEQSDESGS